MFFLRNTFRHKNEIPKASKPILMANTVPPKKKAAPVSLNWLKEISFHLKAQSSYPKSIFPTTTLNAQKIGVNGKMLILAANKKSALFILK